MGSVSLGDLPEVHVGQRQSNILGTDILRPVTVFHIQDRSDISLESASSHALDGKQEVV